MKTERITSFQIFVMTFYLLVGSTVVYGVGTEAKQDAWLAIMIATAIGMGITGWYCLLLMKHPGLNLFDMIRLQAGKPAGAVAAAIYSLYFLYMSARDLRDFCELSNTVIFEDTPMEVIAFTLMLTAVYGVTLGLEVLARTSEIFLPYTIGFAFLVSMMLFFGGNIDPLQLLPVLSDGMAPVWRGVFPTGITFPFGEMVTFLIIGASLSGKSSVTRPILLSTLLSGVVLAYFAVIKVTVLGAEGAARAVFPLLEAAKFVSIANFIERLDALIVFTMMSGLFVKICIYFYCALKSLSFLSGKPYRTMSLPMGMLVCLCSILTASNMAEHTKEGLKLVPYWLHYPLQFVVPIIVGIAVLLRPKKKGVEQGHDNL